MAAIVSEVTATSITIDTAGGRGTEVKTETYELGKDVKVFYRVPSAAVRGERGSADSLPMTMADVAVKTRVSRCSSTMSSKGGPEHRHRTPVPCTATVQSVDATKRTILVRAGRAGDDVDLTIAKDARVIVKGQAGKLDAVAVGAEVQLTLSPDRAKVLILQTPPPAAVASASSQVQRWIEEPIRTKFKSGRSGLPRFSAALSHENSISALAIGSEVV